MTEKAQNEEILKGAENPILEMPEPPDAKLIMQSCLERKKAKQWSRQHAKVTTRRNRGLPHLKS
jgi:hypothetical protein